MDRTILLVNFLKKRKLTFDLLNNLVKGVCHQKHLTNFNIAYYLSSFDGLGNSFSDIDIYVISEYLQGINERLELGNTEVDIEFISTKHIHSLLINSESLTEKDLKLIWRLQSGYYPANDLPTLNELQSFPLKDTILNWFYGTSYEAYDNGKKLFKSKNYIASNESFRSSIVNSINSLNIINDNIIVKSKWIVSSFYHNKAYGNYDFFKRVEDLIIYPHVEKEQLETYCLLLEELATDMIFRIEMDR